MTVLALSDVMQPLAAGAFVLLLGLLGLRSVRRIFADSPLEPPNDPLGSYSSRKMVLVTVVCLGAGSTLLIVALFRLVS